MESSAEILIVGAGIGGLAAALALAQQGYSSTVLEQADELLEIGAGIQLAPNALRMLDRLGVLDEIYAKCVRPPRAVMVSALDGRELASIEFGDEFLRTYGYPYVVTHRSDLHFTLLHACESTDKVTIRTGQRVIELNETPTGVRVVTASGDSCLAGVVVGADGIRSVVRAHVINGDAPKPMGDVAFRATTPISSVGREIATGDVTWWSAPKMHLMQYPVRGGELFNQVAVLTSEQFDPANPDSEGWGTSTELRERYADKVAPVTEGVALVDQDRRWVMFDRQPDENWTVGHTTLLGDAAHPMVPYLAQGGCQAIEDAVVLADSLAANRSNVGEALRQYQAERLPRTSLVQRRARLMGEVAHSDGLMAALRDQLLATLEPTDFRYVDWLYSYESPFVSAETSR